MPVEVLISQIGSVVSFFIGAILLAAAIFYGINSYRSSVDPVSKKRADRISRILLQEAQIFAYLGFSFGMRNINFLYLAFLFQAGIIIFYHWARLSAWFSEHVLNRIGPLRRTRVK